jgi:hypothetical protein
MCHIKEIKKYFGTFALLAICNLSLLGNARADEVYCRMNNSTRLNDGDTATIDWTVTTSGVRKSAIPGHSPTKGCAINWRTLGEYNRPIEVMQAPKIGKFENVPVYRVFYSSSQPGEDEFLVRQYWLNGRNGEQNSAIVKYVVHVVDHAQ